MEENIIMNEVEETVEIDETETDDIIWVDDAPVILTEDEDSGSGMAAKIVGGLIALAAGAGIAAVVKNRQKIKDWRQKRRINKLEKAGFMVISPDEQEEVAKFGAIGCSEETEEVEVLEEE